MMVGVDIGGTKTAVVAGIGHKIMQRTAFETLDCNSTIEKIIEIISGIDHIEAIGISCGGPLNSKTGVILSPPNLPGWDNVQIVSILKEAFNIPVMIQNDANACAIAEWRFGAGIGCNNMIFLTFGTGLGAGLILDGKIYTGTNDMAGEVGHIRLCDNGPVGYGKSGSFEGFCSGGGIAALGKIRATEQLQMGKTVSYCTSYDQLQAITAKSIAQCANDGHADAAEVYKECGRKLGYGLSILIDVLNPERIVIGSVYQRSGNLLIDEMNRVISAETLELSRSVCTVVPAQLGDEIGDWAALAVAHECLKLNAQNK